MDWPARIVAGRLFSGWRRVLVSESWMGEIS